MTQATRRVDVIVKLGGSCLTCKDRLETLHQGNLQLAVNEVRFLWEQKIRLIVIHGAGSYGHFQAKQYLVSKGLQMDRAKSLEGFSKTRASVTRLNNIFVSALVESGVPAVGISPFLQWETHTSNDLSTSAVTQRLNKHCIEEIVRVLDFGLVPVLHGDAVFDAQQGIAILSGDVIARELAFALSPKHVVFVTDVDGVFDRPPSLPNAQLLEVLEIRNGKLSMPQTSIAAHDVSGGIAGKLERAVEIVRAGGSVAIVKVGSRSIYGLLTTGQLSSGTRLISGCET